MCNFAKTQEIPLERRKGEGRLIIDCQFSKLET